MQAEAVEAVEVVERKLHDPILHGFLVGRKLATVQLSGSQGQTSKYQVPKISSYQSGQKRLGMTKCRMKGDRLVGNLRVPRKISINSRVDEERP